MKKLLALLLLFGIVGCASIPEQENSYKPDTRTTYQRYSEMVDYKAMARPLYGAGSVIAGNTKERRTFVYQSAANDQAIMMCQNLYNDICALYMQGDNIVWGKSKNEKLNIESNKRQVAEKEKKLAVINALKDRCISYGFTGNNNIAACLQREAQHDYEIEQMQLAQKRLMAQQNQTQTAPETPWYLFILEGLAEGIEEGYKQKALIQTMDTRYEKKDIYRYCRPNC